MTYQSGNFERRYPWDSHATGPYQVPNRKERDFGPPRLFYGQETHVPAGAFARAAQNPHQFGEPISYGSPGEARPFGEPIYDPYLFRPGHFGNVPYRSPRQAGEFQRVDYPVRGGYPRDWQVGTANQPRYQESGARFQTPARYGLRNDPFRQQYNSPRAAEDFSGSGPMGYRRSDESIYEDVCGMLTADPRIDASEMEVAVENGVVRLTGEIQDRDMKRTAEDVVDLARGVRDVRNELELKE